MRNGGKIYILCRQQTFGPCIAVNQKHCTVSPFLASHEETGQEVLAASIAF